MGLPGEGIGVAFFGVAVGFDLFGAVEELGHVVGETGAAAFANGLFGGPELGEGLHGDFALLDATDLVAVHAAAQQSGGGAAEGFDVHSYRIFRHGDQNAAGAVAEVEVHPLQPHTLRIAQEGLAVFATAEGDTVPVEVGQELLQELEGFEHAETASQGFDTRDLVATLRDDFVHQLRNGGFGALLHLVEKEEVEQGKL